MTNDAHAKFNELVFLTNRRAFLSVKTQDDKIFMNNAGIERIVCNEESTGTLQKRFHRRAFTSWNYCERNRHMSWQGELSQVRSIESFEERSSFQSFAKDSVVSCVIDHDVFCRSEKETKAKALF